MSETIKPWPWVLATRAWFKAWHNDWLRLTDARISLIPVILGCLLMALPQGLDVVRDLVDSANVYLLHGNMFSGPALGSYFRWSCFLASCVWSGVIAWYWPHLLTQSRVAEAEPHWFRWLRRILGIAPLLAGLLAILTTGRGHLGDVWLGLAEFVLATGLLTLFYIKRLALVRRYLKHSWVRRPSRIMEPLLLRFAGRPNRGLTLGDDVFVLWTVLQSLLVLILFSTPGIRTDFAGAVGSASIAFGAVGSIIATLSGVVLLLSGARAPVVTLGAIFILLASVVNDNHDIRAMPSDLVARRPTLDAAFTQWKLKNPNPNEPIILVATAGGASRAGYWTATVLRALDDRTDGRFASHVFAISSVSGGTLGAMGYAAWVADHPVADGSCRYWAPDRLKFDQRFDGSDYLSPALAGLVYPDLAQKLVPFPLFVDRATLLEESWDHGWAAAAHDTPACGSPADPGRFAGDYMEIWRRSLFGNGPWVPIVLANGTLVEDGKRVITAPIVIDSLIFEDSHDFAQLFGNQSVSASTATLNSARFPLVSPAATVPGPDGSHHIVDGGYFDNGGIETVYDVARYLRATLKATQPIIIIEINNDDASPGKDSALDLARYPNNMDPATVGRIPLGVASAKGGALGAAPGTVAILGAFYKTRTSRGVLGAKRLSSLKAIGLTDAYRATFNLGPLLANRRTAMSWSLSLSSRGAMDDALQALGPWLVGKARTDVEKAQAQFGPNIGCERVAADQIAAVIGATVPAEPVNCKSDSCDAQWVGVPLGLDRTAAAPNSQALLPRNDGAIAREGKPTPCKNTAGSR